MACSGGTHPRTLLGRWDLDQKKQESLMHWCWWGGLGGKGVRLVGLGGSMLMGRDPCCDYVIWQGGVYS